MYKIKTKYIDLHSHSHPLSINSRHLWLFLKVHWSQKLQTAYVKQYKWILGTSSGIHLPLSIDVLNLDTQ